MKSLFLALLLLALQAQAAPDPALWRAQQAVQRGDLARALHLMRPLAERGHFGAQLSMAQLYELPGKQRDLARALHWYTQAAAQGSPDALEAVGLAYYLGRGTPRNAALAAEWLQQAADRGAEASPYILGVMWEQGDGVPRDLRLARGWFDRAARLGDVAAAVRRDALDKELDAAPTAPP